MLRLGPRLVVAGTHSGVGKTTLATGLMAALRRRGLVVAAAKVGPDFIDPGYHAAATGRPGRNLDTYLSGRAAIGPLAGRAAQGAEILIVEGVMGLFDGASARGGEERLPPASTAEVAALLEAPVVLVVDAAAMSGSVAALVHGFLTFSPAVRLAGVICNRVGSDGHEALLAEALEDLGTPLLGALRRDDALLWRDRHLGLVPVVEHPDAVAAGIDRLAAAIERHCDVDGLLAVARSAPPRSEPELAPARPSGRARIAVASGPAFSFLYPDNLERLAEAGAELLELDPRRDAAVPAEADGLLLAGGFPEVYAEALSANPRLRADLRRRIQGGLVTWAECGGLLFLARELDGHPLVGALEVDATMTERLHLGYRRARVLVDNPLAPAGGELVGHEFHYSRCDPPGAALELSGRFGTERAGHASATLLASYLHLHLGADPAPAERFVATAAAGSVGT